MRHPLRHIFCVLGFSLVPLSLSAGGYFLGVDRDDNLFNRRLANPSVHWKLIVQATQMPNGHAINFDTVQRQLNAAFSAWSNRPELTLTFTYGGMESRNASEQWERNDGINALIFKQMPDYKIGNRVVSLYGLTYINGTAEPETASGHLPGDGLIRDVDIDFNVNQSDIFYSNFLVILATHEIGHMIGLRHTFIENAMMFPGKSFNSPTALQADDIAWVQKEYLQPTYPLETGTLSGTVVDAVTRKGFPGIHVVAINTDHPYSFDGDVLESGVAVSAFSNPDGTFSIPNLPAGTYIVYAQDLGTSGIDLGETVSKFLSTAQYQIKGDSTYYFAPEFYDGPDKECNLEDISDYRNAKPIAVNANTHIANIVFVSNVSSASERICARTLDHSDDDGGGCAVRLPAQENRLFPLTLLLPIAVALIYRRKGFFEL